MIVGGSGGFRRRGSSSQKSLLVSSPHSKLMGMGTTKISGQELAVDFLMKRSVDWRGGVGID